MGWQIAIGDVLIAQSAALLLSLIVGVIALPGATFSGLRFDPRLCPEIWSSGSRLMVIQLLALVATQSDTWLVSFLATPDVVAGYGVATRMAQLVSLPMIVLTGIFPPLMAAWVPNPESHDKLERVIGIAVIAGLTGSLAIAAAYNLYGGLILSLLFGTAYSGYHDCLSLLTFGHLANVAAGPCFALLLMSKHENTVLKITALDAIIGIVAALCGYALFGATGIAAGFAFGMMVQAVLLSHRSQKWVGIRTYLCSRTLRGARELAFGR
jgi:O-antigen/teichoic acid export membrane protein